MTPAPQRIPGILPICPPARKPLPNDIEHSVPVQVRRSSRIRDNARPRTESRALQQRRLGLIADEKIEPLVKPTDSLSNSPETSTATKLLGMVGQALNSSAENYLAPNAGPRGEFPDIGTGSPAQRGKERMNTMGAAARDYYRLQGEDPDKYDYQQGRQNFELISRTFGDPLPRDLALAVANWLYSLEETRTLEQQAVAVRGMERHWLVRKMS